MSVEPPKKKTLRIRWERECAKKDQDIARLTEQNDFLYREQHHSHVRIEELKQEVNHLNHRNMVLTLWIAHHCKVSLDGFTADQLNDMVPLTGNVTDSDSQ